MVQIGKINKLTIKEIQPGRILLEGGELAEILLKPPRNPRKYKIGDEVDVFVYVDNNQNLIATVQKPYSIVGECAKLTVVATSSAGAFLGWGLENDLFVPKSEQQNNMRVGNSYVVYTFHSKKSNRITASSKLDKYLNQQPAQYTEGEEVDLLVYAESELGYSAVVNNSHVGMIYKNEIFQKVTIGQQLTGYIKKVREDLKIDLRLQKTGTLSFDDVAQNILNTIQDCGGMVAVTDKSPAEEIYEMFGVSKKVFKKAIGSLYKKKLITLANDSTRVIDENNIT
jgi:predicted RNA-binding protein (virulence factor B family)